LNEVTITLLRENHYPSLLSCRFGDAILCGPLALVNHTCDRDVLFQVTKIKPLKLPMSWDGWTFLTLKPSDQIFKKGEEILVHYDTCDQLWFKCSNCGQEKGSNLKTNLAIE
jgi:hypothetical protein